MLRYLYTNTLDLKPFMIKNINICDLSEKELSQVLIKYFQRLSLDIYQSMFRDLYYYLPDFIIFTDGIEFIFINKKTYEVICLLKYPILNYDMKLSSDIKDYEFDDDFEKASYTNDRFRYFNLINAIDLGFRFSSYSESLNNNLEGFQQLINKHNMKGLTKWKK